MDPIANTIDVVDLQGIPNVVHNVNSQEEAEALLLGRPYGAFVIWRLKRFAVVSYMDMTDKAVAHVVVEKSNNEFRLRNNPKEKTYINLQALLDSRKYLDQSLDVEEVTVMSTGGSAGAGAGDGNMQKEAKEQKELLEQEMRRRRMPLRLPKAPMFVAPKQNEPGLESDMWKEYEPFPSYLTYSLGRRVWWVAFVVSTLATLVAIAFSVPYAMHYEESTAAMTEILAIGQNGLENDVGHIGVEGEVWGAHIEECTAELGEWKDHLLKLEHNLEHHFDASPTSDVLRHHLVALVAASVGIFFAVVFGPPAGPLQKHRSTWVISAWVLAATAVFVTLSTWWYSSMCAETTQLLHMIPFWLRDVFAEDPECEAALGRLRLWLEDHPPHLWLRVSGLPQIAVPASRDLPFYAVATFALVGFLSSAGLIARVSIHHHFARRDRKRAEAAKAGKKQD